MALRTCLVSFTDLSGIRHSTEVMAETIYEASVLAIKAFQASGFMDQMPGAASRFEIEVKVPTVRHELRVGQLTQWLDRGVSNPIEESKRKRLKALLESR